MSAVWHYSLDGVQKHGPVSETELWLRLQTGEFPPDTLVWAEGLADWEPASKVAPFALIWGPEPPPRPRPEASSPVRLPAPESRLLPDRPRPWIRFWARWLDFFVWAFVLGSLPLPLSPELLQDPPVWLTLAFLASWMGVESLLLSKFGTTPGKWLRRIRVENEAGRPPRFLQALQRSFLVLVVGMGLGIKFVGMLAMLLSLGHLQSRGRTFWDRKTRCQVRHGEIDPLRGGTALFLILTILYLLVLGLQNLPR
ncbi:MAG: RDD family protein [Planctomycetota bacterium]